MPEYIIKLKSHVDNNDYYLLWSTVVEAPTTYGQLLPDFKGWYIRVNGTSSESTLNERLARVEKTGCSGWSPFDNLDELLDSYNWNKPSDKHLTREQIIETFCHPSNES